MRKIEPYITKSASVTVRIAESLKQRLEVSARREHRSLSAQIEHALTRAVASEHPPESVRAGKFLGRFVGRKVPTEADLREVRRTLWARLTHEA